MAKLPLIVQVWERTPQQKSQLLGVLRLNLQTVAASVLESGLGEFQEQWLDPAQSSLLVKYNDFLPVQDIAQKEELGQLFTVLAFGTPK